MAAKYKLTRTSLLYYDSIGLLCPSARSEAGYRLYSEEDEARLRNILLFRSMGIPLARIKEILDCRGSMLANALMIRLDELNREIGELKGRQKKIIDLLKGVESFGQFLGQEDATQLGRILLSGIRPLEWHEKFEAESPELHREFLKILDSIPRDIKESIQASLDSLPEEERHRLGRLIDMNDAS